MTYKELIEQTYEECSFNPPASEEDIAALEKRVGDLPEELKEFLRESDGAQLGVLVQMFGIRQCIGYTFGSVLDEWQDPEFKEMYPNSMELFFFADDGMGGFFGYQKLASGKYGGISYWDHETDEVTPFRQPRLNGFIRACEEYLE